MNNINESVEITIKDIKADIISCPTCGYKMRTDLLSDRCPNCGQKIKYIVSADAIRKAVTE